MTDKHLSTQFDADLNAINTKLLQMGGLVESQIEVAMRALADFDADLADQVITREQQPTRWKSRSMPIAATSSPGASRPRATCAW